MNRYLIPILMLLVVILGISCNQNQREPEPTYVLFDISTKTIVDIPQLLYADDPMTWEEKLCHYEKGHLDFIAGAGDKIVVEVSLVGDKGRWSVDAVVGGYYGVAEKLNCRHSRDCHHSWFILDEDHQQTAPWNDEFIAPADGQYYLGIKALLSHEGEKPPIAHMTIKRYIAANSK